MNAKELAEKLRAPFPPDDIEWRPQLSAHKAQQKGQQLWLPYVTARAVMERLDEVFGPFGWTSSFKPVSFKDEDGFLCTIEVASETVPLTSRTDGAPNTDIEPIKGGVSGSLKRAAVQLGIGRYLYNEPPCWLPVGQRPDARHVHSEPEPARAPAQQSAPQPQQAQPAQQAPPQGGNQSLWAKLSGGAPPPKSLMFPVSKKNDPSRTYFVVLEELDRGEERAWGWIEKMHQERIPSERMASEIADPIMANRHQARREEQYLDVAAELEAADMVEPSAAEVGWSDDDGAPF